MPRFHLRNAATRYARIDQHHRMGYLVGHRTEGRSRRAVDPLCVVADRVLDQAVGL